MAEGVDPGDGREFNSYEMKGHSVSVSWQEDGRDGGCFASFFKCECSCGVVRFWCDAACSHSRAVHVQRLHNPGVSSQTALPPSISPSLSFSLNVCSMLSAARRRRHRWSAGLHTSTSSLCHSGAGRGQRVKVIEGAGANGSTMLRMDKVR